MKKKTKASPLLTKILPATATTKSVVSNSYLVTDGLKLHQVGKLDEAAVIYQAVLTQAPLNKMQRASALSLLGTIHLQKSQFAEAEKLFKESLSINANDAITHNNLGVAYKQLENKEAAYIHFEQAVKLNANYADALNNYGAALLGKQQINEAIALLKRAIIVNPNYADAHYNLGTAYQSMLFCDEAEACFQRAISINPQYSSALFNSGLLRLLRGEFEQGWRLYEYRWTDQLEQFVHNFSQPLWLGDASLDGKTIFLYAEQGLGDFIQFCRYALLVEKLGANIIIYVPEVLMSLATSLSKNFTYIPRVGTQMRVDCEFDYHCPLMSLPLAFKTKVDTIPTGVPYLSTPADKIALWKKKLEPKSAPRIGLVWSGAAGHLNDVNRSITLKLLAPILREDVEYHVLQKEIRPHDMDELAHLKLTHNFRIHCDDLHDFSDTAALISEMDLVISVDTSIAHLTGALGMPLWLLVPFFPDFRWLLDREDSPWYPTAKLFRQQQLGDWAVALQRLKLSQDDFLNHAPVKKPVVQNQTASREETNHAIKLHQANNFSDALDIYLKLLNSTPNNTEVLTLIATLYLQEQKLDLSKKYFEKSLALDDKNITTLHNYALLLEKLDRNEDAIQYLDKVLAMNAKYEDAYKNKANLLKKIGKLDAVIDNYQASVLNITNSADLYFRLANQLRDMGLKQEALVAMTQATRLDAKHSRAYNYLGNILLDLNQVGEAVSSYQQAIAVNPKYANAYSNLAVAYLALNQYQEAVSACDSALALNADLPATQTNRANALQNLHRFDEAVSAYQKVIKSHNNYFAARLNLGLLHLLLGDYAQGLTYFEARWQSTQIPIPIDIRCKPLWLGKEPIAGKTLLLYHEQGYGDTIQFVRYAALIASKGISKLYLIINKPLFNLITDSLNKLPNAESIVVLTDKSSLPQFDLQCPLMSLPLAFGTEVTSIPADVPYLFANQTLVQKWQARLSEKTSTKPKIGLAWSSTSAHINDKNRSIPLCLLAQLFKLDVDFHCIQKEIRPEDDAAFATSNIQSHQAHLTNFSETAALIHEMDLVICVDTSVAHLAGALGKHVWILLPFVPDFRWLLTREDSPWYPTARLFRQPKVGDWQSVIDDLQIALVDKFAIATNQPSFNNQGNTFLAQGLYDEAKRMYEKALLQNPNNAIANNNLGSALQKLKQYDDALNAFDHAILISKEYATPYLNKSYLKLLLADYAEGWQLYEWRWKNNQFLKSLREFDQPLWLGDTPIEGKTILIYPEQGLGDYIHFCRYIPLVQALGAKVLVEAPAPLVNLLQHSIKNVEFVGPATPPEGFNYQCPIMSLPLAFKTTLQTIPANIPYLHVPKKTQSLWENKLGKKTNPRIGLIWAGSKNHADNKQRSISLGELSVLLQLKLEFHALQKEVSQQDKLTVTLLQQFNKNIYDHQLDLHNFCATAAIINEMDLIITVDTATAHLAGALGKPVWILLPHTADFRWLLEREDSPWYPTAKLFRQATPNDWAALIGRVMLALKAEFSC